MPKRVIKPAGMIGFLVIWIGQLVSGLCSGMSQFGLTIWMYQQTHSATAMGLMYTFWLTPLVALSPFVGVMVDRYNRKLMMMASDIMAAAATAGVLILFAAGRLEFWHLYVSALLRGIGASFQYPAYTAAISSMVPKEQLGRVNGLWSLGGGGTGVVAPLLAGALLPAIGLTPILSLDLLTFFTAIGALALVAVPQPTRTAEGVRAKGTILKEAVIGFRYILVRPGLLGLQLFFLIGNLFWGIAGAIMAPMVLARTQQNNLIYGTVNSFGAAGGIAGGALMTAWGGFKRRIRGVLGGWLFGGLVGFVLIGLNFGLVGWAAGAALGTFASVIIDASSDAIWQSKVDADLQGRVSSTRVVLSWITLPVAPVIGGTLADFVFEPAMRGQGWLPGAVGWLVGSGPGAGMGLLIVLCGLCIAAVALAAAFIPAVRNVEDLLPDQVQIPLQPGPATLE